MIIKLQFYLMLIVYTYLGLSRQDGTYFASYNDLLMHFSGYVVLINSCLLAFGNKADKVSMVLSLFAYSLMIEIIQYFLPYRDFSVLDLLANGLGLFVGQIFGLTIISLLIRFKSLMDSNES